MTDTPQDHPAIKVPAKVLATSQLLAAPGLLPQVKGPKVATVSRNHNEKILDELFPGVMQNVNIKPHEDNPNPMLQSMVDDDGDWIFGAWTNAADLIYIDDSYPDHYKAYILYHEVTHIKQFRTKGSPPKSFQEMLGFELNSYPKTQKWVQSENGKKYFLDDKRFGDAKDENYAAVEKTAKGVTEEVRAVFVGSLALKFVTIGKKFPLGIIRIVLGAKFEEAAPFGMPIEEIFLRNMAGNNFLPQIRNEVLYRTDDLYLQNEKGREARWAAVGY